MSKEPIKINGMAAVRYDSINECLFDDSKATRTYLDSTPCKRAKVPGEFIAFRRSKRGSNYIMVVCSEYYISFESNCLSDEQIKEFFGSAALECKKIIHNCDRMNLTVRNLRKIFKKVFSKFKEIERIDKFDLSKFETNTLPEFLKTKSCRAKLFMTSNLMSKIGV